MAKLVDNENTVRPFLPKLLPGLIKIEGNVADPEARGVVTKAIKTLQEVGKCTGDGTDLPPAKIQTASLSSPIVLVAIKEVATDSTLETTSPLVHYIASLVANLVNARNFELTEWEVCLIPYVSLALDHAIRANSAGTIVRAILEKSALDEGESAEVFEDEEEGEDLCNCTFSLAYGAKILLNTATLRLKRGHRYGLCGRNGSGKSTLMVRSSFHLLVAAPSDFIFSLV
jgi:elongation factor 3